MIILTNGLTDTVDEGCLKVCYSLVKRIKSKYENVSVVSYDRKSELSDMFLSINKLMLSKELISVINEKNEPVLYIPFPARPNFTALRIFILSCMAKKGLKVVLSMRQQYNFIAKVLLKISKAQFVVFSDDAYKSYCDIVSQKRVTHLKTGVDTKTFSPVSEKESRELKKKYGFDENKKVVLHVGHIKSGRNIQQLLKINPEYQVVLVGSTLTKDEQDTSLKEQLLKSDNIRIIDDYLEHIEQIYQLSDVYFFPVVQSGNCIDVPLSCLEAAACGKPVVTTLYGEMKAFHDKSGFYFIDDMEKESINKLIEKAMNLGGNKDSVKAYDWNNAVEKLVNSL